MTTKLVNKQLLGEIGESIQSSEFTNIKNLNDLIQHNFPIFDLIADKGTEKYIFSVKARYKYGQNGKINHIYNILHNTSTSTVASKYKKAIDLLKNYGINTDNLHYCFIVAPFEENKDCIYYYDEFININPEYNTNNILDNKISYFGVNMNDDNLKKYKIFGIHSWNYIQNKFLQ